MKAKPPDHQAIPIDDIHIDPANARVHGDRNRATIRASLARFGPGRSLVLDGNNVVRAGNGAIEEARQAGFDEVLIVEPKANQLVAVKRADWSATEAAAYGIADNRSTDLGSFFATFPVELAARCIAAGSSEKGACPTCGAPWERVTEDGDIKPLRGNSTAGPKAATGEPFGRMANGYSRSGWTPGIRETSTLGWRPTCSHDAEPQPCTVFDPFMGAATTLVACEQLGRLGRGIELSPQYVAIALERLEGLGLSPVLSGPAS
jgi:hypothetical protein